jgi:4-amino-4-deoxy-L-arabinose transferase-like glycosyltransferase
MKKVFILLGIFLSTFVIYFFAKDRWIGYETVPDNKIFDERNYALQGISLRTNGVPIGWSDIGEYTKMPAQIGETTLSGFSILVGGVKATPSNLKSFPYPVYAVDQLDFGFGNQHLRFVQPFLDHPPLGGLIYSLGIPKNAKNFLDIKPADYRKPALYLAIITSILLFALVFQTFKNPFIATLSVIVYNSVPTYLLATRYALLENLVAPLALLMLNLLLLAHGLSKKRKTSLFLIILSGLTAGLTILAKESGIGFLLGGIILLIIYKTGRLKVFSYLGASLLPVVTYICWGWWFFPSLFEKIFLINSTRKFLGSINFINIFQGVGFQNFPYDGWWIWGFISVIFLVYLGRKVAMPLTVPFLCSLFTILFFTSINYSWYYFALIPFLAAASGYALWKLITKPDPILLATFFLFALSSSFYWGYTVFHLPPNGLTYRILITFFTVAGLIRIIFSKTKIIVTGWAIVFCLLIFEVIKWNSFSILYIVANWGKLAIPTFPVL